MDAKTSINCCIYVVNYVPKDIIMVFLGYIMIFSRVHYQRPLFIYLLFKKVCVKSWCSTRCSPLSYNGWWCSRGWNRLNRSSSCEETRSGNGRTRMCRRWNSVCTRGIRMVDG